LIGKAACILAANVGGCILQKSIDDFDGGREGEIGFSRKDAVDVEDR